MRSDQNGFFYLFTSVSQIVKKSIVIFRPNEVYSPRRS